MLLSFLGLAVLDSVNPSALVITLYLLSRKCALPRVAVYIAAIFGTYLTLGALMMMGLGALLPSLNAVGGSRMWLIAEGLIGSGMLLYAFRTPPKRTAEPSVVPSVGSYAALFLLGVTVTTMELATAVPYFGAIALLTAADLPIDGWLPLLVLYNIIFVLPPLLLLIGHSILGARLGSQYEEWKQQLQAGARETMLWIFGLVGGGLLVSSIVEYVARFN